MWAVLGLGMRVCVLLLQMVSNVSHSLTLSQISHQGEDTKLDVCLQYSVSMCLCDV